MYVEQSHLIAGISIGAVWISPIISASTKLSVIIAILPDILEIGPKEGSSQH